MHAELAAYNDAMVAAMVLDDAAALQRQRRTTAAELSLQPLDPLNETASVPARVAFLNELHAEVYGQLCERVLERHAAAQRRLPASSPVLRATPTQVAAREQLRVAIATTTSADLLSVRRELLPWLQYHTGERPAKGLHGAQHHACTIATITLHQSILPVQTWAPLTSTFCTTAATLLRLRHLQRCNL